MDLKFDHLWQQKELSDLDVVLTLRSERDQAPAGHEGCSTTEGLVTKLFSFPGHSVILSSSPFLRARLLRWQHKRPREDDITPDSSTVQGSRLRGAHRTAEIPHNGTPASADAAAGPSTSQPGTGHQGSLPQQMGDAHQQTGNDGASTSRRPQLVLTLDSADQQPAAMAVLEALYATKPLPELLSGLQQEQQLQVAILADMWELPIISAAAARRLADLNTAGQLSDSATQQLLTSQALPVCLESLVKVVLLAMFGDLEAVWTDEALQAKLLGLPLCAIKLLLSCDKLKVASEDTVLYTAGRYADSINDPEQRKFVQRELAPLIRVKHLSLLWLTAAVSSASAEDMLMSSMRPNLRLLLMQRSAQAAGSDAVLGPLPLGESSAAERTSWKAPQRYHVPVNSVTRAWQVPIQDIQQAAQQCAADKDRHSLQIPGLTPPLGGVAFGASLSFTWEQLSPAGVVIKLLPTVNKSLPDDAFIGFTARFKVAGGNHRSVVPVTGLKSFQHNAAVPQGSHVGICDLAPMASSQGWDDRAWAAAGLPSSGNLAITMTVSQVSHMPFAARSAQPEARHAVTPADREMYQRVMQQWQEQRREMQLEVLQRHGLGQALQRQGQPQELQRQPALQQQQQHALQQAVQQHMMHQIAQQRGQRLP